MVALNPNTVEGDIPTSRRQWSGWSPGRRDGTLPRHTDRSSDLAFQGAEPSARQHVRRAGRPLERPASQEGDLGLDRVRRRRLRHRRRRRRQEAHRLHRPRRRFRPADQLVAGPLPEGPVREHPRPGAQGRHGQGRRTSARPSTTRSPRVSTKPRVAEVKSPFAKGNEGQISKDGRSVLVELQGPRRRRTRRRSAIDPVVAAVDRVKAAEPRRLRRRVRRRQRQQGAVEVVLGRLQEGRDALAADHAADPRRSPSARLSPPASRCCWG